MPGITKLFEPVEIGKFSIPNRVVFTAHGTGFANLEGEFTARHINYHRKRAEGGVGLIIVESTYVRPPYWPTEAGLVRDNQVRTLALLMDEIHKFETKAFVQLHHAGRELNTFIAGESPCGPSVPPDFWEHMHRAAFKYSPKEKGYGLSREQILQLIEDYSQAALRAKQAGADGIEIHGAHGYLVSHFLSPATNWRTDEYGGDVQGRVLFTQEILRRIRELCGPDFAIGIRINGNDYIKGGIDSKLAAVYAGLIEEAGVDYISVSAGFYGSFPASILPIGEPPGIFVHLAAKVKEAVGIPVITAGRINDPRLAEQVLREGKSDLVGMTRALMADPEMLQKARKGAFQGIRKCIGCLACVDQMVFTGIRCLVNPEVGREGQVPLEKAKKTEDVLVIGGGPAGLKAAETAILRGHNVTIYEKEPFLGGKLRYAAMIARRQEMLDPVIYLERRLHELGARVEWEEASKETIIRENPGVVIVATGAKPLLPKKSYAGGPSACHAVDVFAQEVEVGMRVLVIGNSLIALQTCDWLAERGKEVTLISETKSLIPELYGVTLYYIRNRFGLLGVKMLRPALIEVVNGAEVLVSQNDEPVKIAGVDTLVYTDFEPDTGLAGEIKEANRRVEVIGSAFQVGLAVNAIEQGFNIGREL